MILPLERVYTVKESYGLDSEDFAMLIEAQVSIEVCINGPREATGSEKDRSSFQLRITTFNYISGEVSKGWLWPESKAGAPKKGNE